VKALLSTAASRAWLGIVAIGVIVVVVVFGLQLMPRLGAGQDVLDASKPALTEGAVKGEVAATKLTGQFVDLADPLMTKGGGATEVRTLVRMISHRTGVSAKRARAFLRREAPHTEALLRALPLSAVARESDRLTAFLALTLNVTPEDVQDLLARDYPHLFQTLSELPSVTSGWRNVPGVAGLTRFDGRRVKTMPEVSDYLRGDVVDTIEEQSDHVRSLAGWGGIGYLSTLLLVVGLLAIAFGLLHARWSASHPSGRRAWGIVVAAGVLLLIAVGALQIVPRFLDADTAITALEPAFQDERVDGLRAGTDLVVQTVRFADPLVTTAGGASDEVPKLETYISEQTGLTERQVRGRLNDAVPHTAALLQAIPLTEVSQEVSPLLAVLARKLGVSGDKLVVTLRRRTPGLAQALLSVRPVTAGWDAIPDSRDFERFDGLTPVSSMPAFADYLDRDAVPVIESEQGNFHKLEGTVVPIVAVPGVLIGIALILVIYGVMMMFLATKPPVRT
jgi:hypothetical protein